MSAAPKPASPVRRQPNPEIRAAAQAYNARYGLPPIIEDHYVPVDDVAARTVADAYDVLPAVDDHPDVVLAYRAFAREVKQQWWYAKVELGVTFEPWEKPGQPYLDSQQMMDDLRHNNHLYFFTGGEPHPILSTPDHDIGFTPNDQFRAVHDVFGHAAEGYGFGPRGEHAAWIAHSQMFTPTAQRAMTTETWGQNAWFNYGPHTYDANGSPLDIPASEKPFATQKVALLPVAFCDWRSAVRRGEKGGVTHHSSATGDCRTAA